MDEDQKSTTTETTVGIMTPTTESTIGEGGMDDTLQAQQLEIVPDRVWNRIIGEIQKADPNNADAVDSSKNKAAADALHRFLTGYANRSQLLRFFQSDQVPARLEDATKKASEKLKEAELETDKNGTEDKRLALELARIDQQRCDLRHQRWKESEKRFQDSLRSLRVNAPYNGHTYDYAKYEKAYCKLFTDELSELKKRFEAIDRETAAAKVARAMDRRVPSRIEEVERRMLDKELPSVMSWLFPE